MRTRTMTALGCSMAVAVVTGALAQDWPQWRGPNRDARVSGFDAPETWPASLTKKWSVPVGDGVATPALVGDRIYVYAREEGKEIARALNAKSGEELWRYEVEAPARRGPDGGFPGPRATPAVADGKVVLLGVHGTVTCLEAETGKVVWKKDEFEGSIPRFATSSSPIVVDGVCVVQLGGDENGALVGYDLATGKERWRWTGEAPAYASPALTTVDGVTAIVVPTDRSMIAVDAATGKLLWKTEYVQGRYNAASPITDGDQLVYAGPTRGLTAVSLTAKDETLTVTDLWKSPDATVQFNTPVKRGNLIFGISNAGQVFCVNAESGEMLWTAPLAEENAEGGDERTPPARPEGTRPEGARPEGDRPERPDGDQPQRGEGQPDSGERGAGERGPEGQPGGFRRPGGPGGFGQRGGPGGFRGGFGGRGGGGGRGGYGTIVDAGDAILALTPNGQLVAFAPSGGAFEPLARYQVAEQGTYAYPIVTDDGIYVKDQNDLTLWSFE